MGARGTRWHPEGDGKVYWLGTVTTDGTVADAVVDLGDYIGLDEDLSTGTEGSVAPWMRVTASLPSDITVQPSSTSTTRPANEEELVGGMTKSEYEADNMSGGLGDPMRDLSPVFVDDENAEAADNQDALVLRVSSDGNAPNQNLWLKEQGRFSGFYEGYIRLTDADGDGSKADNPNTDEDDSEPKDNWGLATRGATGPGMGDDEYAVIGVESGPVTISYKNSNGDTRSISITIDKDSPSIQVDSPVDGTASTDDSPELIGTFTDSGGSGLREDSFKVYADNRTSPTDAEPVWDLGVLDEATPTRIAVMSA